MIGIGLLFNSVVSSVYAQTPSRNELERIVFEQESLINIDETEAAELRVWLEDEVEEFLDAGRLAPLYVQIGHGGKKYGWKAFAEPAETFYALSLAYPFLSPELQSRVKAFLDQEFVDYPPHEVARYPMNDWPRRENFIVPDDMADSEGSNVRGGHMIGRLYPLWAYAYYTDSWDKVTAEWNEIKNIFHSFVSTYNCPTDSEDGNMNRYLSGLIGYVRIAHKMGDSIEVDRGLDELARIIPNRLANARWRGDQCEYNLNCYGCTWDDSCKGDDGGPWYSGCPGDGMFVDFGWQRARIYQFWDLTTESGRLLETYAPEAMQSCIDYTKRNLSNWYIVKDEQNALTGENWAELPDVPMSLFQMMAFIERSGGDKLKLYANAPLCKGDLYHIQKLVHAIQAYGTLCYEDLRTPEDECTDGSKSVSRKSVSRGVADYRDALTYTISLFGTGQPVTVTDPIPSALGYVPDSANVTPETGALSVDGNSVLHWTGVLTADVPLQITFGATVAVTMPTFVRNTAFVYSGESTSECSATLIANGYRTYVPITIKDWWAPP